MEKLKNMMKMGKNPLKVNIKMDQEMEKVKNIIKMEKFYLMVNI